MEPFLENNGRGFCIASDFLDKVFDRKYDDMIMIIYSFWK